MGGEGREEGEGAAATPLLATINVSDNQVGIVIDIVVIVVIIIAIIITINASIVNDFFGKCSNSAEFLGFKERLLQPRFFADFEYYVSYQLTPSPPSIPVSVVIQIQIGFGILRPLQLRVGFIKTVAYGNVSPNPIYPSKGRVTLTKWMDFRKSSSFHSFSFLSTLTSSMYSQQIRVQPVWITIYHFRFPLIKQSFFLFHHSSMRSLIQLINSRATRGITG